MEVRFNSVSMQYDENDKTVLKDMSFDIENHSLVSILGPSGCGKSTTLMLISGLLFPTDGQIFFDDKDVTKKDAVQRKVGMVFQNYALYPHLSVQDNIMFPLKMAGVNKKKRLEKAQELADLVQISEHLNKKPGQLSGGQQQRVAIARALMMEPQVLLFDEPTAALDPEITAQIVSIIRELAETNITQVIVTHEVEVARKTASRVVYMENGHIVEQGDASCFTEPQTEAFKNYLSH